MAVHLLVAVSALASIVFCGLVLARNRRSLIFIPVALVCCIAPVQEYLGLRIFDIPGTERAPDFPLLYHLATFALLAALLEGVLLLVRKQGGSARGDMLAWSCRIVAISAAAALFFVRVQLPVVWPGSIALYILTAAGVALFFGRLFLDLSILFTLENMYRFARSHQRRLGLVSLLAAAGIVLFDAVLCMRSILYKTLTPGYVLAETVLFAVCFPILLIGLVRYRMSQEKIIFSPASIYSSFTLLLAGALLLALGATVGLAWRFGVHFTHFEAFVAGFAILVFVIFAAASKPVRDRGRRLINKHIYRSKYDYRDQFFRLHRTYLPGRQLHDSVNILLENLTHIMAIGEAFVFLRREQDGNFHLLAPEDSTVRHAGSLFCTSPLVASFEKDESPCLFMRPPERLTPREQAARAEPLVGELGMAAVFPVRHRTELLGLLAIRNVRGNDLDKEDRDLVSVFALAIGNVFFNCRMLEERIELRQFESFHHISSFIVHDIKNQVATLSLLMKNADANIDNPDFQKSLLRSIRNCSDNLQDLIQKLSVPVKHGELVLAAEDISAIAGEVVAAAGLASMQGIRLEQRLAATKSVPVDRTSVFYIVKNLVINAIEAMNGSGTITIATGNTEALPPDFRDAFGLGGPVLAGRSVYLVVSDTGPGMSREFVETRLFRPFSTTKDKGIGIGLYQSKVLMERMGGRLFCSSRQGIGTGFCCMF